MKNIFKYMIPCLATTAVATMGSTNADDYQTITVNGSVTNQAEVVEVGFQVSKASDFSTSATYYNVDEVVQDFSYTIGGLEEKTTYYVRAYAATRTAGIIFSEPKTVTTPAAPIFPLDGTYTVKEMAFDDESGEWVAPEETYEITVAFDEKTSGIVA